MNYLYVVIHEFVKDTRSSGLGLHSLKIMWMVQESPHVPRFKFPVF